MESVVLIIVQSVWFSVPMYVANMAPVLVKKVPLLDVPIDHGRTWRGKPIFGSHKTYRGFVIGILCAVIVASAQKALFMGGVWTNLSVMDLSIVSAPALGFLLGFGALAGDAVESFFKRQVGIAPGKSWIFFDQVDYIVGGLALVSLIYVPPIPHLVVMLLIGSVGSFASSYIGYHLGLKEAKV